MSLENEALVTEFCTCLGGGDMAKVVAYLSEDVVYHNVPWQPVTGHAGVRQVLDPFIQGANNALEKMEIKHTTSAGPIVMNERLETWAKRDVRLRLPVVGVFEIANGKITKWTDYFDAHTIAPLMSVL